MKKNFFCETSKRESVAQQAVLFLKLPNYKLFTAHSLRQTSAIIFADFGGDFFDIKLLGG